jgi:hypothetical protein
MLTAIEMDPAEIRFIRKVFIEERGMEVSNEPIISAGSISLDSSCITRLWYRGEILTSPFILIHYCLTKKNIQQTIHYNYHQNYECAFLIYDA